MIVVRQMPLGPGIAVAGSSARRFVMAKRRAVKRQLIKTRADRRYVQRGERGAFGESADMGRATAADRSRRTRTRTRSRTTTTTRSRTTKGRGHR